MNRWGHSPAPTKITLIYIIYELIIFMGCLVKEPRRVVQGVVNVQGMVNDSSGGIDSFDSFRRGS